MEELADSLPTWAYCVLAVAAVLLANVPLCGVIACIAAYEHVPPRVWAVSALASTLVSGGVAMLFLEYKRMAMEKSRMTVRHVKDVYVQVK